MGSVENAAYIASRTHAGVLFENVHLQEEIIAGHSLMCFSVAIFTAYSHKVFPFYPQDNSWTPIVRKRWDQMGEEVRMGCCATNATVHVGQ